MIVQKRQAAFTPAQIEFQQAALAAHNTGRKRHCVANLQLDDKISRSAQDYADKLAQGTAKGHSNNPDYGENLYSVGGGSAPIKSVKG